MKNFLLPHYYKIIGFVLALIGIVFAVFYLKLDFSFKIPVFAIISVYLETKYFAVFQNNFVDEITLLLLIIGFGLIVFSKEKNEKESFTALREKALVKATLLNAFFLIFSLFFVYGGVFMGIMVFNLFSVFIFYLLFFYLSLKKSKQQTQDL